MRDTMQRIGARRIGARRIGMFVAMLGTLSLVQSAMAEEPLRIDVTIKEHVFTPAEIHVPAGRPAVLVVTNQDAGPEEFDSSALKVEKVIMGGTYGTVRLGPLGPGRYPFMGEFHPDTAKGVVIAE